MGKGMTGSRPRWARVLVSILAVYLLFSTIIVLGWVGLGTYAAIDHNKDAEFCDHDVPPGYRNIVNGRDCKIRWGYIIATHGLLTVIALAVSQAPAIGAVWWIRLRYPSGQSEQSSRARSH